MEKRAEQRVSTFIISLLLVGGIIAILGITLADVHNKYPQTQYNASDIETYNKLADIQTQAMALKNESQSLSEQKKESSGIFYVVKSMTSNAIDAFKITFTSIDIFDDMVAGAFKQNFLGGSGNILRNMIIGIVLIFILVGVFLAAVIKWRL